MHLYQMFWYVFKDDTCDEFHQANDTWSKTALLATTFLNSNDKRGCQSSQSDYCYHCQNEPALNKMNENFEGEF